jgi:hypothetical protein
MIGNNQMGNCNSDNNNSSDSWSIVDIIVDPVKNDNCQDDHRDDPRNDHRNDPRYLKFITSCRGADEKTNSFFSSESVISKNHDQTFINTCYVDGFNEAAINDKIAICKYIYSKKYIQPNIANTVNAANTANTANATDATSTNDPTTEYKFINPNVFVSCCERSAIKCISWMLTMNQFNPLVINIGFETACYKENTKVMDILYNETQNYIKQYLNDSDNMYVFLRTIIVDKLTKSNQWFRDRITTEKINIQLVFMKFCKNDSSDIVSSFLDFFETFLQKKDIYNAFVCTCNNGGNINTLKLLKERYDNIDDLIFNDLSPCGQSRLVRTTRLFEEIMSNKFLNESHRLILEWINTLIKIKITIKPIDESTSPVININGYDVDKCLKELHEKNNVLQAYNFDKQMIDSLIHDLIETACIDGANIDTTSIHPGNKYIEKIIESSSPLIKKEKSVKKSTSTNHYLCVMIWIESIINREQLFNLLLHSDTYVKKEMVAHLLGYHLNPRRKNLSYKEMMIDRLGLLVADEESLKNTGKIFKSAYNEQCQNECPVCMCEYDMILSCGHVMCMTCAYKWYIQKSNQLMCQICRGSIELSSSYCLF